MCSANGVLLNLWLLVSWLLLHNLFHMLYGICNSYSIKSLYFSGFSMTLLLSREPEPIWFAGMSSQQKTSLNKGICLVPVPYSCAWVPASWGSAAARVLLPEPSPGPPPCTFVCSLLLWGEKQATVALQPAMRLRVSRIDFHLWKKKSTPRKVWGICLKGKSMAPRRMCYSPTLVLDLAPSLLGEFKAFRGLDIM